MQYKSKLFLKFLQISVLLVLTMVYLSACKASSSVNVNFDSNPQNGGNLNIAIKLDDQAASIIRGDLYKPVDFAKIFKTSELNKLGFKTSVNKNTVNISRKFKSGDDLNNILKALGGDGVFVSNVDSTTSFIKENRTVILKVHLSKLRDSFLNNDKVKSALATNGIKFSDYETLVNDAFKVSTLKITIDDKFVNQKVTQVINGSKIQDESISTNGSKVRYSFLIGNIGALLCLFFAIILAYRKWHTPKLISNSEQN